mmetsp:Transcript_6536/g.10343  ORF Transcript_6536/g.10343 Transcript_6536/m.10343 type:complete len:450 (-) Transcript_6536:105-1454(-)
MVAHQRSRSLAEFTLYTVMSTLCLKTPLLKGSSSTHVLIRNWHASTQLVNSRRFISQSKQTRNTTQSRKQVELSTEPPTPYPPTNPKFNGWVKLQHEHRFYKPDVDAAPNVRALFLFSGLLCGVFITWLRPTDFRHEWRFSSPLPDAQHTKYSSFKPTESVQETQVREADIFNDRINAFAYTACCGVTGGAMGAWWVRLWSRPLRMRQTNAFETRQTMLTLCHNWHRGTIKGTFWGVSGLLAMIYSGVFCSYLFAGHLFSNKYVDKSFWDWMELTYHRHIDSKREYEFYLDLEERERESTFMAIAPAPSIPPKSAAAADNTATTSDEGQQHRKYTYLSEEEYARQQQQNTAIRERRRKFYDKKVKNLEWDTNVYLGSMHIPYYKLDEKQKAMRWNMAREMALLSAACSIYIVVPIFVVSTAVSVRAYYRFWWKLCEQISATKKMPHTLF